MTTIAYRDGVLAADSAITYDAAIPTRHSKIRRLDDGSLFASSGYVSSGIRAFEWFQKGRCDPAPTNLGDGFSAILVSPSGEIQTFDETMVPIVGEAPWYALGSGWKFAWGAMAAGASAIEAVRIACDVDSGSSGPVQVVLLHEES